MVDLEKSEKLPPEHRYFNVSTIWIFYFRIAIRILYALRIPHELVTLLSIACGAVSAYLFYVGALIPAAIMLHLKDIFDASDGAIARLTGRGHLIGRYLDSIGDFAVLTLVMLSIAVAAIPIHGIVFLIWGLIAVFSTFIQCSFFNFYQIAYLDVYGVNRLSSKHDERSRSDVADNDFGVPARAFLAVLRFLYAVIYSWQDRLVAKVDSLIARIGPEVARERRYSSKPLMVLQSPLCFGTHIFVIIVAAVFGKPHLSLIFISVFMNIYLVVVLIIRTVSPRFIEA